MSNTYIQICYSVKLLWAAGRLLSPISFWMALCQACPKTSWWSRSPRLWTHVSPCSALSSGWLASQRHHPQASWWGDCVFWHLPEETSAQLDWSSATPWSSSKALRCHWPVPEVLGHLGCTSCFLGSLLWKLAFIIIEDLHTSLLL